MTTFLGKKPELMRVLKDHISVCHVNLWTLNQKLAEKKQFLIQLHCSSAHQ